MANQVDRAGRYQAVVLDHSLDKTQAGAPQVVVRFGLIGLYAPNPEAEKPDQPKDIMYDWKAFGIEVRGYFTLLCKADPKTGEVRANDVSLRQLSEGLAWDRNTEDAYERLNDGQSFVGRECQVVIGANDMAGSRNPWRLNSLHAPDWDGQGQALRRVEAAELAGIKALMQAKGGNGGSARTLPPLQRPPMPGATATNGHANGRAAPGAAPSSSSAPVAAPATIPTAATQPAQGSQVPGRALPPLPRLPPMSPPPGVAPAAPPFAPGGPGNYEPPTGPATRQQAWAAFEARWAKRGDKTLTMDQKVAEFRGVISEMFPGLGEEVLDEHAWGTIAREGPDKVIPF